MLSIYLIFYQVQSCVAYKSVAYKKACNSSLRILKSIPGISGLQGTSSGICDLNF